MTTFAPRLCSASALRPRFLFVAWILLTAAGMSGCGSGSSPTNPSGPQLSGNTSVTVVLSSTANDQLSQYIVAFQNITLTSQSGKTVALLSATPDTALDAEFIHLNGRAEPLVTVSIPQDIYTAATLTLGGANFTCVTVAPSGSGAAGDLSTSTFDYGQVPAADVAVTLPSPITVTGDSMGLSLDLLVSQSASYPSCYYTGIESYSITPTFSLTPVNFASQPTNSENGKVAGLSGEITAMEQNSESFTLSVPDGEPFPRSISVSSSNGTVYQGISGSSALAVGTFLNMDGTVQSDGSLLATRIAVFNPSAVNVTAGPVLRLAPGQSLLYSGGVLEQGPLFGGLYLGMGADLVFTDAQFQISGELTNLQSLPFVASFDSSNMVAGQNAYISFTLLPNCCGNAAGTAQTVTLLPQTIDGTVIGSSTSGSFTVYTVELASYDLFPTLASQPGQPLLNNPDQIEVYIDNSAQMLNTQPLASGSTLRFYGLVFNDNGTLRMDCAQVNDGVDFTPQPNANERGNVAQAQTTRRAGPGGIEQITLTTRSH